MTNKITLELLRELAPTTKPTVLSKYVDPLNEIAEHIGLTKNPVRLAMFLAQVAHESGGFLATKENLNYSAQSLMKTWPKRFPTSAVAREYARNPQKIANKVYADRMGNGPESSGDGFKFIGRGLIQLTGRNNYTKFAKAIDSSLDDTVSFLETPEGAVASAGWFWDVNKLNIWADKNDFVGVTRRINGGTNGMDDRKQKFVKALKALS